jgi:hypothetical protein
MFTPAIFKEKFRRTIQAWGYHEFLPKSEDSSAQNKTKSQGDNVRDYHAQLYKVLESFTRAGPQLCNVVTLPIGPTGSMCVDIVTCILFVIQDMQEGDLTHPTFDDIVTLAMLVTRSWTIPMLCVNLSLAKT